MSRAKTQLPGQQIIEIQPQEPGRISVTQGTTLHISDEMLKDISKCWYIQCAQYLLSRWANGLRTRLTNPLLSKRSLCFVWLTKLLCRLAIKCLLRTIPVFRMHALCNNPSDNEPPARLHTQNAPLVEHGHNIQNGRSQTRQQQPAALQNRSTNLIVRPHTALVSLQ